MWGEHKTWLHYTRHILAADVSSALFLAAYISRGASSKSYVPALEVIDLQKYKVISLPAKVRVAMRERLTIPLVFVVGKN